MRTKAELKKLVLRSLRSQGFSIRKGRIAENNGRDKAVLRSLHATAVQHRIEQAKSGLRRHESELLGKIASGPDVSPAHMRPRLVEVEADSFDELLFRYARLHWSIPVSAGYGRRLRFVVYDEANDKLIGIIGLGDPVFALGPRDRWVGWDIEARRKRLQCTMDAFVLGAVPPYSHLLCGKLVAMLLASNEVRHAFKRKYQGQTSIVSGRPLDGRLALISTTSALGRSSVYNRIKFKGQDVFKSVGFTMGSGEFQFSNGVYRDLRSFGSRYCSATAKNETWGIGFRNKREVLRKVLPRLGLSGDLLYHQVEREVFVVPLASNSQAFLRGDHERLRWFNRSAADIFSWFRDRWLLPRAERDASFMSFEKEAFRLWPSHGSL
jgi:hypothetical protein